MCSMRVRIEKHGGSRASRALSRATGHLRLRHGRCRFNDRTSDVIINWGTSTRRFSNATYINAPEAVGRACDKRESFKAFREYEVPAVPSTEAAYTAMQWLQDGHTVYARTLTQANSGRGIVVVHPPANGVVTPNTLPAAPLYTRGVVCNKEFRVHVMMGDVIRVQQKRKRRGCTYDAVHHEIRNATNGWVFCQDNVALPDGARAAAITAVASLGLDFGAVDIGTDREGACYVYEVNTAPGLEGTTLAAYSAALTVAGVRGIIARKGVIL